MRDELNAQTITLSQAIEKVMSNFEEINAYFISKIAEQIKKIGELKPTDVNRIILMTEWGADINDINRRLADATQTSIQQLMVVYQKVLDDTYSDPRFAQALQHTQLTPRDVARLNQYAQAQSRQTAEQIVNLSNTTAVQQQYRDAVDKAVLAVSSGLTDYKSATRDIIHNLGYNGMQVQYESGYHRRLDTALRQNIVDGTNQLAQQASDMMGEALGYDAYEISAHAMSAPDHEPVQGRVFLKAEFEKLQSGLAFTDIDGRQYEPIKRPIGEWNCKHFAMSFSTQYSKRKWTNEQLDDFAKQNEEGCDIDGKHYTKYGASQLMRELETEIRREKDAAVAAQKAGDDTLRKQCQERINALTAKYHSIAKQAGLRPKPDRLRVEGFRAVKLN